MIKTKLSIDVTDENRQTLEAIKKEERASYGNTINTLIEIFCRIPSEVKRELIEFCKTRMSELNESMKKAGEYEIQTLENKRNTYVDIATFLNNRNWVNLYDVKKEIKMKKINIKDGVLICPSDYVILNEECAKDFKYASVVEVRNANFKIPHFIYLSDIKIGEYNIHIIKRIETMCKEKWPKFKEILDSVVEPIPDPEREWEYINQEEIDAAPQIGHFEVYCQGDPNYPVRFNPPMGTRIVRKYD